MPYFWCRLVFWCCLYASCNHIFIYEICLSFDMQVKIDTPTDVELRVLQCCVATKLLTKGIVNENYRCHRWRSGDESDARIRTYVSNVKRYSRCLQLFKTCSELNLKLRLSVTDYSAGPRLRHRRRFRSSPSLVCQSVPCSCRSATTMQIGWPSSATDAGHPCSSWQWIIDIYRNPAAFAVLLCWRLERYGTKRGKGMPHSIPSWHRTT
jgi:hypothetical protein